ncbi:MAG: hypothetical protein Q8L39_13370 [Burkholderiales bacterium]|nr:hypothetical protein [Burkholderiales bacterium]
MREKLAALRAALQDLKRASVFRKALAAETALVKAVDLIEDMMREIEEMKKREGGGSK